METTSHVDHVLYAMIATIYLVRFFCFSWINIKKILKFWMIVLYFRIMLFQHATSFICFHIHAATSSHYTTSFTAKNIKDEVFPF